MRTSNLEVTGSRKDLEAIRVTSAAEGGREDTLGQPALSVIPFFHRLLEKRAGRQGKHQLLSAHLVGKRGPRSEEGECPESSRIHDISWSSMVALNLS